MIASVQITAFVFTADLLMRGPKPTPIVLTERQQACLSRIARRQTNP
jgi:hypothetical protein